MYKQYCTKVRIPQIVVISFIASIKVNVMALSWEKIWQKMLVCQWDTVQFIVFYYERTKEVHHKNDECFSLYNTDYVALCT